MKLVGHKTEAIYRRYAIIIEANLSDGVKKLAALSSVKSESSGTRVVPIASRTAQEQLKSEALAW